MPDNMLAVSFDAQLYSKAVLFKCLYWYGALHSVGVKLVDNNYIITLSKLSSEPYSPDEARKIVQDLERDMLDYSLREIVFRETQNIRDLMIAKAFSHVNLNIVNPSDISDPVGFNVDAVCSTDEGQTLG